MRTRTTNQEIVEYYGQIWENVKHMGDFVRNLRVRYEKEVGI